MNESTTNLAPSTYAATHPDRPAVITSLGQTVTFAELAARSCRLAQALFAHGLSPGDHVAVLRPNDHRIHEVVWGLQRSSLYYTAVNRREMGLLKRLRLSPLPTWMLLAAIFINTMIIAGVQVVVLLLVGRFGDHVHGPAALAPFLVAIVVGMLSFTAMGVAASTLVPNADAAGPVVSVSCFLLVALFGLYFPINSGSGLATFANSFPVRHLITALVSLFDRVGTSPWAWHDVLTIAVWGVVGAVVSLRRWQWSP